VIAKGETMNIRIMLADDHKIVREGLAGLLAKKGFEIIGEAETGHEAVRMARELEPDVVLMDVSMPELNGFEATRQILADNSHIRVIGLSMHSDKRFVTKMLKAGARGYLRKNCSSDELVHAIRTVAAGEFYLSQKISNLMVQDFIRTETRSEAEGQAALTSKEAEVLQLIAEGMPTKEIAERLSASVKTVEKHREHIMSKLNIHSIAELTKYAIREGITSADE